MTRVGIEPEAPTQTVLGKQVSDLQTNVALSNNVFSGTLKYVTGYTQFSGDPELQEGNYLAVKFSLDDWDEYDTVKVGIVPSATGADLVDVKSDPDKNLVARVTNKNTQQIKIVATTAEGDSITQYYGLGGLLVESKT